MNANPQGGVHDSDTTLCIAGAGLAALIALRGLVQAVTRKGQPESCAPLSVIIVDEMGQEQFGRGVAYASPWQPQAPEYRGSRAELLNSPAVRMSLESVIGPDGDFVWWLQQHQSRWQALLGLAWDAQTALLESSGRNDWPAWEAHAVARWLAFNQDKLSVRQYETVYFPRCVYGEYLSDLASKVFAAAAAVGLSVQCIKARATGFTTQNPSLGAHTVLVTSALGEVQALHCHQFIYAAGELEPVPLCKQMYTGNRVMENPYTNNPHRHARINAIRQALRDSPETPFTLALAGCGASAMDQLWAIRNDPALMTALQQGAFKIVVVAPGRFPHSGIILEPSRSAGQVDPLRWIQAPQQQLIEETVARNLGAAGLATAEEYFTAVERALAELELEKTPHLFMTFLRQLGAVEQTIKDGLDDIENFARHYHARLEAKLLFTPYEYWRALADLSLIDGALEKIDGKILRVECASDGLQLATDTAGDLSCSMLLNCTGPRNPVDGNPGSGVLDDLVNCQLGVSNFTGGLAISLEGRIRLADGTYSNSAYLCTQSSIGLCQPSTGGVYTYIGSNRLTAVRVAELAQRIADAIAQDTVLQGLA